MINRTPTPMDSPKCKRGKTLFERWKDLFLYSDTHLLEFVVALHIGFVQDNHRHVPHETLANVFTGIGFILGLFSCICIPTRDIGQRECAITALFAYSLTIHSIAIGYTGSVKKECMALFLSLLFLKWRLMKERIYREIIK